MKYIPILGLMYLIEGRVTKTLIWYHILTYLFIIFLLPQIIAYFI